MTARSYLYVPGDREAMLAKAVARGADAIICDLEDAVAADRKDAARALASEWLGQQGRSVSRPQPELWVRVNAESVADDVEAVAVPGVTGIVAAKADPEVLALVDAALGRAEARHGLPAGSFAVSALVESAAALLVLPQIAAAPRVVRLAIGEADLTSELGMSPSEGEPELLALRVQLVVTSAAAGLQAPVGPVSTDFTDLDALRVSTRRLVRLGFRARSAIHPAQVPVINEVLTPTPHEVEAARALVRRFEAAGGAATTDDDGRLIDLAVIRGARDVLARAGAAALAGSREEATH